MRKPYILGLTGGIGTGKSTVSGILRGEGAFIVDADDISRHALDIGTECYQAVKETFGDLILREDGSVNRGRLAQIVFNDEAQLQCLNSIIHPYVRKQIYAETEKAAALDVDIVVWDIPLLFEGGYESDTNAVLVVTCPLKLRLARLYLRSGMKEDEALARMRAQMPEEERCRKADFVINNDGTLETLKEKVKLAIRQLHITDNE